MAGKSGVLMALTAAFLISSAISAAAQTGGTGGTGGGSAGGAAVAPSGSSGSAGSTFRSAPAIGPGGVPMAPGAANPNVPMPRISSGGTLIAPGPAANVPGSSPDVAGPNWLGSALRPGSSANGPTGTTTGSGATSGLGTTPNIMVEESPGKGGTVSATANPTAGTARAPGRAAVTSTAKATARLHRR